MDLQKAYDTIHWEFLKETLQFLQFPEKFIGWIMECVTTTTFSVTVNGQMNGFFKGKRGLRQGDPLSPYLFTLCLEMLSRTLKKATESADINFHPKCGPLGITHIAYADDLLLLSRGDVLSVGILMDSLHAFGNTAGLISNVQKSNVYLAGVSDNVKLQILQITGFQVGSLPFKYLGIPMYSIKLKLSDYGSLLDRLSNKIKSWPRNTLSYAGRLELIRSVLQGVQFFWMNILPIPEGVIAKIYSTCRSFFWNSKHPHVAWKKVCMPLEYGGLGLRNLHFWNKALLCKLLWNIHIKKDSLWIKWVNHYYTNDIWNYTHRKDDSALMKLLINIKNQMCSNGDTVTDITNGLQHWFTQSTSASDHAYRWFLHNQANWPWKPIIFKPGIFPKHRITFWMFAHKKLLTKHRQVYISDKQCMLCGDHAEDFDHLLFKCKISCDLWDRMRNWMGLLKKMQSENALLNAFRGIYRGSTNLHKRRIATTAATIYHIWDMRNRRIFQGEVPDLNQIVRKIKTIIHGMHPLNFGVEC